VENARLDLAEHYSFESVVGFNRIDTDQTGEIDASDVKAFCDDNNLNCSLDEAARLIDQYDENGNGKLSYGEFCQLVLPATNDHLRSIAKSREAEYRYIKSAFLSSPIESALVNLVTKEIEYQRAVEEVKRELNARPDFTSQKCFDCIEKADPYLTIDRNEIRDFVHEFYTVLSDDDLDAIIRRCDTDEDEQLSEAEFKEIIIRTKIQPVATKYMRDSKRHTYIEESNENRSTNRYNWRDVYDKSYNGNQNKDNTEYGTKYGKGWYCSSSKVNPSCTCGEVS